MRWRGQDLLDERNDLGNVVQYHDNVCEDDGVVATDHFLAFGETLPGSDLVRNVLWQRLVDMLHRSFEGVL